MTELQDLSTTAGVTTTCAQTEAKDHLVSLEVTCGQHVEPPVVVGFIDQDYR